MRILDRGGFAAALVFLLGSFAGPASAAVFTVGTTGEFATIQAGLDAALAAGGGNEIRVAVGTYVERLVVTDTDLITALSLRGGWDPTFSTQTLDPRTTVVDANSLGRALQSLTRFPFVIEALTFRRGRVVNDSGEPLAAGYGGGVHVAVYGGSLIFRHCRVEDSKLEWDGNGARGGGMWVEGSAPIEILDSSFARNSSHNLGDGQLAQGAALQTHTQGPLLLARLTITDSRTEAKLAAGGALNVLSDAGTAVVEDVVISRSNTVGRPTDGVAAAFYAISAGHVEARRLRVSASTPKKAIQGWEPRQVFVFTSSAGTVRLADSLIYGGRNGLFAQSFGDGFLRLVNLTITGHTANGATLVNTSTKAPLLANSIVAQNKTDLSTSGKISQVKNLTGKDPKFVDAKKKDFRLASGSPAANAGSLKVAGGLSAVDLAGLPRIKNSKVDVGAYESQ